MIISNDGKKVVAYNGDYKPVNVYSGRKKVAGYVTEEVEGKRIEVEDTYNDVLDVSVQGRHEQRSEKAVWWNQMVNNGNFEEGTKNWTLQSPSKTSMNATGGELKVTVLEDTYKGRIIQYCSFYKDHKYYVSFDYFGGYSILNTAQFIIRSSPETAINYTNVKNNEWIHYGFTIVTKGDAARFDLFTSNNTQTGVLAGDYCIYKNICIFDLTAMFGAGHEPTVEQFRKMFPCDYYPYNSGQWMYAPKGQWVKFNQLIPNGWFDENTDLSTWSISSQPIEKTSDGIIVTSRPSETSINYNSGISYDNFTYNQNHKYLARIKAYHAETGTYQFKLGRKVISNNSTVVINLKSENPNKPYYEIIFKDATDYLPAVSIGIRIWPSYMSVPAVLTLKYINVFDLTEMFGEGNEPTLEEFNKLYPNEFYEYTEGMYIDTGGFVVDGEVVPNDVDTTFMTPMPELPEEIKAVEEPKVKVSSEKAPSRFEGQEVTLPFTLYGANGINDTCEPCVLVDGEWKCRVTRRWGSVNLGSCKWYINNGENNATRFYTVIPNLKHNGYVLTTNYSNIVATTYSVDGIIAYANNTFYYRNSYYKDYSVSEFKDAMIGNILVYELAEPVIELYDPIPLRTLPIHTIVECDAEMRGMIKRVE